MATGTSRAPQVLLGPVLTPPRNLDTNHGFLSTMNQLSCKLQDFLTHGLSSFGDFEPRGSFVSISVISTMVESRLFDFQFTSPSQNISAGSTTKVSSDSIFRIGSISKLFTVYALLLNNGFAHWEQPVTDYIPELRHFHGHPGNNLSVDYVAWETVTVGSLASHLSGIGREYSAADLSVFPLPWTELGLPQLVGQHRSKCGQGAMAPPCQRDEYFQGFVYRHPIVPSHSTPVYSNTAFRILAYVLEVIGGASFEEILNRDIIQPLGLTHTSVHMPQSNSAGIIPQGESMWDYDIGDEAPGGGLYSSSSDLTTLSRHILLSSQLPPSVTRRWMKPVTHTSALTLSIGAPWEIWRTKSNITDGRIIDLYTKAGSIGLYESNLVLIPDFNVAFAIMTAGPDNNIVKVVNEIVVQDLIPALGRAAQEEAAINFAGLYISDVNTNSSIHLVADEGPGLLVATWVSQGSDLLATAEKYAKATKGGQIRSVRLQPTGLVEPTFSGNRVAFRALFDTDREFGSTFKVFDQSLNMWARVDQTIYGKVGVDDFIFDIDEQGMATHVEPRVLGIKLRRT